MVGRNPYYTMTKKNPKITKPPSAKGQNRGQKALGARAAYFNPYLAALVDPEHYPPIGVPDRFSRLVHKSKIIKQVPLEFISNKSAGVVVPDIDETVGYSSTNTAVATDLPWLHFNISEGSDTNQLSQPGRNSDWYGNSKVPTWTHLYDRKASLVTTTKGASFRFYSSILTLDNDDPVSVELLKGTGNDRAYGLPVTAGGTCVIAFRTRTTTVGANNLKGYARTYNSTTKAYTETASSFASDVSDGSVTITFPSGATHLVEYGFQVAASATVTFESVRPIITTGVHTSQAHLVYEAVGDADEHALLNSLSHNHRVSAQSLWLIYNGSALSNGKVAVAHIQDRMPRGASNHFDYDYLSKIPGAYSGPLNKGAYCFWKPTDIEDEKFSDERFDDDSRGYIAWAIVANDADAQNVTARICTHIESVTTNQVVSPVPSLVQPQWCLQAQVELANFPSAMENDLHMRALAEKIASAAKSAGKWVAGAGALMGITPLAEFAPPVVAAGTAMTGFGDGMEKFLKSIP